MDHRKVRKIYWICWLLASVIVVLGALLPDEKMQKIVIAIGIIIVIFGNIIAICFNLLVFLFIYFTHIFNIII